ncbi:MAG: DNA repair protein RecN, partial [Clostridia bacterium]|nr:DNA repair protein RecN [Clostridia bacterium]
QVDEISKAELEKGEDEELKEQREIYANAEQITGAVAEAYMNIYGGDEAAYDSISAAVDALAAVNGVNPKLKSMYEALSGVMYSLEDVAHEVKEFGDSVEFDEQALNDVEERLDLISKLKRKYGAEIEDILKYLETARKDLEDIKLSDERTNELKEELCSIVSELQGYGKELSKRRAKYAEVLEKGIEQSLHELNMERSKFKVNIETSDEFYENGMDRVEFLISTNPGEPLKPLVKIASGGELSRVMLAIKSILADSDNVDTLIFDEIDTGVSGRAAMSIAKKLSEIGRGKQVICITHLPQLTAAADNHYLIQKNTEGEMASTTLTELDGEQREIELARIIDGGEVTELALSHAREMLAKNAE